MNDHDNSSKVDAKDTTAFEADIHPGLRLPGPVEFLLVAAVWVASCSGFFISGPFGNSPITLFDMMQMVWMFACFLGFFACFIWLYCLATRLVFWICYTISFLGSTKTHTPNAGEAGSTSTGAENASATISTSESSGNSATKK